jgi:hypothetical protein
MVTATITSLGSTAASVYVQTILPLTTTFTPRPECTDTLTLTSYTVGGDASSLMAQGSGLFGGGAYPSSRGAYLPASCFPSDFSLLTGVTGVATYYSPGICPYGYTHNASTIVSTPSSDLRSGERTALCCPKSYALNFNTLFSPPVPQCESMLS